MPFLSGFCGNPSSLHRPGRISRGALESAREQVATLVGASPSQVVFTSGGTESNNLALKGCAARGCGRSVVIGATEHPSVVEPALALEWVGHEVVRLPVDQNGLLDVAGFAEIGAENTALVSVMVANNETGVIQDLSALADYCCEHGVPLHCDAVQAAGKIPLRFADSGISLMTVSAHKIGGPKGVGALVMDKAIDLQPLLHGGGQERGLRGGTENVAAIVGFGRAAELALQGLENFSGQLLPIRERLHNGLLELPAVTVFAHAAKRIPNTLMFGTRGMDGEMLVMELDRKGFAVSSGSACSSMGKGPSHVLLAMGVEPELAASAVRISLGAGNTIEEADRFIRAFSELLATGAVV